MINIEQFKKDYELFESKYIRVKTEQEAREVCLHAASIMHIDETHTDYEYASTVEISNDGLSNVLSTTSRFINSICPPGSLSKEVEITEFINSSKEQLIEKYR